MTCYDSPLGRLLLCADGDGLTALRFEWQKAPWASRCADTPDGGEILIAACRWLDEYFSGRVPEVMPPIHADGTAFQKEVWQLLTEIPYGETTTYGALAKTLAQRSGKTVSAQAVGGAVGHNPISVIIPCHRVVGADGSLTGYAGGIEKKLWLLRHEGAEMAALYVPKRGTAL